MAGLATAASGATTWNLVKKKLVNNAAIDELAGPAEGGAEETPGPSIKKRGRKAESDEPKATKKRVRKNVIKTEEGDNGLSSPAPSNDQPKQPKTPKKRAKKTVPKVEDDDNDLSALGLSNNDEPETPTKSARPIQGDNSLSAVGLSSPVASDNAAEE